MPGVANAHSPVGAIQAQAGVQLSPGSTQVATPGSLVTYTHTLSNTGHSLDTFSVRASSSHAWPVSLLGGVYPTGTSVLPLSLNAGATTTLKVSLSVPAGDALGAGSITDHLVVTASSHLSPALCVTATDTTQVSRPSTLSLPVITKSPLPPQVKLGVDFGRLVTHTDVISDDFPLARQMGATWNRVLFPWFIIEQTPGQYNWEPYDTIFARAAAVGLEPLPIVYGAPEWAAEHNCGPISDTLAFENFLEAALTRYGPIVDAWEFTNEPDGQYPHPWGPSAGCWGFHPEAYATQLGIFYTKVKALDPGALVVFGGLAYDNWVDGNVERNFFTETLRYGAGQFFDAANLHYYPINPIDFPTMAHKINEISEIMARHNVQGKQIWVTETGMWVNDIGYEPLNGSLTLQQDFIVQEIARGFGAGADAILWFDPREFPTGPGRVQRWLISQEHEPINGYTTFQHLAGKIAGTHCTGRYQAVPSNVEAYEFVTAGRSLYILWSNTSTTTVTMPAQSDAVLTDRDGQNSQVIPVQDGQVSFELGPRAVFLELAPNSSAR
ncbi:MAG: hypothetical protein JW850_07330 [Thermoflexales bacterium]|nr:hypothetical protein [Thermoflexales bacterium]